MAQPFFALTWQPHAAPSDFDDFLASLTEAEYAALQAEAEPLYAALHATLEAYCTAHAPVSQGACLDAVQALAHALHCQVNADAADA